MHSERVSMSAEDIRMANDLYLSCGVVWCVLRQNAFFKRIGLRAVFSFGFRSLQLVHMRDQFQAVRHLLLLSDDVTMKVEYAPAEFEQIRNGQLGDDFYIRFVFGDFL